MRNLLLSEYRVELSRLAAKHGADGGAALRDDHANWSSVLGGCDIGIDLDVASRTRCLFPVLRVGSSSSLPSDPLLALARLRDAEATIHRAVLAFAELGKVSVWPDGAPCDRCSGKGNSRSGTCATCLHILKNMG